MKFTITLNRVIYEIEVSPERHEPLPTKITVNGKELPVSVNETWDKEFPRHLVIDGIPHEAEFEYGEDGFPKRIWLDGCPSDVGIEFLGKSKLSKVKRSAFITEGQLNTITAPMPGKIVKVNIKEHQKVSMGDLCIVLEAMKMENELEALMSGVVRKVHVKEGDLVDMDQVLVSFEDEDWF